MTTNRAPRFAMVAFLAIMADAVSVSTLNGQDEEAYKRAQAQDSLFVRPFAFGEEALKVGDTFLAASVFKKIHESSGLDVVKAKALYRLKQTGDSVGVRMTIRANRTVSRWHSTRLSVPWYPPRAGWFGLLTEALDRDLSALDTLGIKLSQINYGDDQWVLRAGTFYETLWSEYPDTYWGQRARLDWAVDMWSGAGCKADEAITAIDTLLQRFPNTKLKYDAHWVLGMAQAAVWTGWEDNGMRGDERVAWREEARLKALEHLSTANDNRDRMEIFSSEGLQSDVDNLRLREEIRTGFECP